MPENVVLPASACSFLATVEVGTNGVDAKTAPITLLSRSVNPVYVNEALGQVIHDFAGMRIHKNRIALDYCHNAEQVIGYANHFGVADYGLVASGALVPYSADPTDKATEVIYKAAQGVPYEASIQMGQNVVAQKVKPGVQVEVNGQQFTGPLTVFREWDLRGIAVCPYGKDKDTLSALALSEHKPVVSVTFKEPEAEMPVEKTEEAKSADAEVKAVEANAENDTKAGEAKAVDPAKSAEESSQKVEQSDEAKVKAAQPAEEVSAPVVAPVEAVSLSVKGNDGLKFLESFGDKGGVWYAQGKTFDEAQSLYFAEIKTERDQLLAEKAELMTQLTASRGEETPVTFSADDSAEVKPEAKKFINLPSGLSKFAAALTIPTK